MSARTVDAVSTFREAAPLLRQPFTAEAVKFKVQATWPKDNPTGGLIVCYIDARLVVERLNMVIPDRWADAYEPTAKGLMWCHLTVDGITRSDVGEGDGKGLVSDALKRAAVKFGIGVSLYATPKMRLTVESGQLKQKPTKDGLTCELTPKGESYVRNLYGAWIENHASKAFGEPLDHGDVPDAIGDHEDGEERAAASSPQTPTVPSDGIEDPLDVRDQQRRRPTGPVNLAEKELVTASDIEELARAARGLKPPAIRGAMKAVSVTPPPQDTKREDFFSYVPKAKAARLCEQLEGVTRS